MIFSLAVALTLTRGSVEECDGGRRVNGDGDGTPQLSSEMQSMHRLLRKDQLHHHHPPHLALRPEPEAGGAMRGRPGAGAPGGGPGPGPSGRGPGRARGRAAATGRAAGPRGGPGRVAAAAGGAAEGGAVSVWIVARGRSDAGRGRFRCWDALVGCVTSAGSPHGSDRNWPPCESTTNRRLFLTVLAGTQRQRRQQQQLAEAVPHLPVARGRGEAGRGRVRCRDALVGCVFLLQQQPCCSAPCVDPPGVGVGGVSGGLAMTRR